MRRIRRMFISFMVICFLLVLFGVMIVSMGHIEHSDGYHELADGWDVQVEDEYYEDKFNRTVISAYKPWRCRGV